MDDMVAKTTAKKAAPAPAAAAPAAPVAKPEFDWGLLPDVETVEYTRGESAAPRIDIEAATPDVIKARVTESYEAYLKVFGGSVEKALNGSQSEQAKANREANRKQRVATEEQATEFFRLASRYAKFKGMTLRGKPQEIEGKWYVVFRAKTKETRVRTAA